jgi:hypothetical protein
MCSHCLFPVVVTSLHGTSCYHDHLATRSMAVTDLLQVVPTRLIQAVRNKLLRACCHQLVNNLLHADDIRLVGTTCRTTHHATLLYKMITTCSRLVKKTGNKQCEHILLTSCEIFTRELFNCLLWEQVLDRRYVVFDWFCICLIQIATTPLLTYNYQGEFT